MGCAYLSGRLARRASTRWACLSTAMSGNQPINCTFTVGKLGASRRAAVLTQMLESCVRKRPLTQAILIGERASLIGFPALLLPRGVNLGSVVDIRVTRNEGEEQRKREEFVGLQDDILQMYGVHSPSRTCRASSHTDAQLRCFASAT